MVGLLALAHDRACELELAWAIDADLDAGVPPDLDRLPPSAARAAGLDRPAPAARSSPKRSRERPKGRPVRGSASHS